MPIKSESKRSGMLILACALLAACGGGKAQSPTASTPAKTPSEARGEVVFMHTCNGCHPQGEAGLGGALNSKPLPEAMIKAKVRGTIPGDMPKFGERDLGDADLQAVADYVVALRRQ